MSGMLYTSGTTPFKHHVHPSLQRRLRIFVIVGIIMIFLVAFDLFNGTISYQMALISIVVGSVVGLATSRIFDLTWKQDGNVIVGQIDRLGWVVLIVYIIFESVRATLFQAILHTPPSAATAITFAFVASALLSRVIGMRGKIVRILKEEKILG